MKRHHNIPIFIPHLGCPNTCVFCNQHSISGAKDFSPALVPQIIEQALSTLPDGCGTEIAFFGGSFTGIDRALMLELLELAERYVRQGRVESIRLSTRPDYVDGEVLSLLSRYSVRTVELGIQSMSDPVLRASKRGHTAAQSEAACRAILDAGFSLVGQMMIGLPTSTPEDELYTAERIASMGATGARIYPTVVFRETSLCRMAEQGEYLPLSETVAVERSAAVLRLLLSRGVECLRIGLCASEHLTSPTEVWGGPNHPALGELVWNEYYYRELCDRLSSVPEGGAVELILPPNQISKIVGQHRQNLLRLMQERGIHVLRVTKDATANEAIRFVVRDPSKIIIGGKPLCI